MAARDCNDCRAREEFRKLADEFTAKADDLEGPHRTFGMSIPHWRKNNANGFHGD
jgi:hypothetical protein